MGCICCLKQHQNIQTYKTMSLRHEADLSCPFLWKREVELVGTTSGESPSKEPEDQIEQKTVARGSRRRRTLAVLALLPCAATIALTFHLICEQKTLFLNLPLFLIVPDALLQSHVTAFSSPSTLHSVLPRRQRGVPKPELLLGARRLHLPSVPPAGSGFELLCKWTPPPPQLDPPSLKLFPL